MPLALASSYIEKWLPLQKGLENSIALSQAKKKYRVVRQIEPKFLPQG
jgi:hypothetical protein